jgi:bifunctional non-homologous end joining protein LigD
MTGRRISKKTGELSEKGYLVECLWPKLKIGYTVIDGEVMPPLGATFHDIAGIMNADPDVSLANQRRLGPPRYHAFDVLYLDGEDVRKKPQHERSELAGQFVDSMQGEPNGELFEPVEGHYEDKLGFFKKEVAEGREGVVLKFRYAPYGEGWLKVKRLHELDTVIMGFTDAREGKTGKFKGLIGAVVVGVKKDGQLIRVGQVSGMNDAMRVDFTNRKEYYLGRVMTVEAQEWAKDALAHPRFNRMREDIGPESCTWDKMWADLEATNGGKNLPPREQLSLL